ncbi:hypothetical protein CVT26_002513 [Gymnopilus dilepis]|uniref:Uncharacterized protein n=1 Tax=Gymnopilus dilepis TaxID=231916 RepID=A0A409YNG3_9AGAR|nr:hypothetical protein CVT26_002513 [Gymnopilus dilepis]
MDPNAPSRPKAANHYIRICELGQKVLMRSSRIVTRWHQCLVELRISAYRKMVGAMQLPRPPVSFGRSPSSDLSTYRPAFDNRTGVTPLARPFPLFASNLRLMRISLLVVLGKVAEVLSGPFLWLIVALEESKSSTFLVFFFLQSSAESARDRVTLASNQYTIINVRPAHFKATLASVVTRPGALDQALECKRNENQVCFLRRKCEVRRNLERPVHVLCAYPLR